MQLLQEETDLFFAWQNLEQQVLLRRILPTCFVLCIDEINFQISLVLGIFKINLLVRFVFSIYEIPTTFIITS
jgi:hypothetical protein